MSDVRVHLQGRWRPGQVTCRWMDSSLHPPADIRAAIDTAWEQASSRPGIHLFDGPMCRLESFSATDERLDLVLSRTSYKQFLGTNLRNAHFADRDGWGALANPLGVSCALVSSDGYLMLGRRNERVAYHPGRIHPFAGAMEPHEPLDIFAEARRELAEELAFTADEIADAACLGMVEDTALRQPELICLIRASLTSRQIAARVDQTEHQGSIAIAPTPQAIDQALRDSLLTGVAVGAVRLWADAANRKSPTPQL